MRIGINVDGILTDLESFQYDYGTKYVSEHDMYLINPCGYTVQDKFNFTNEQNSSFWKEYYLYYINKCPIRPYASEVINKLKEDGHEIYIITARGNNIYDWNLKMNKTDSDNILIKWLKKHHINYDNIVFINNNDVYNNNNIDLLIDDNPDTIESISKTNKIIVFNANYNKMINNDNIVRCYSWYDIYNTIKNQ